MTPNDKTSTMLRAVNIVCGLVIVGLVAGLYHIRYSAEGAARDLDSLHRSIADERAVHRTLQAEWSSLNDPRRLQKLADLHLPLAPLAARQIETPRTELQPIPAHLRESPQ